MAFDLVSNNYHIELYGYLKNKIAQEKGNMECTVKECDTYITQKKEYDVTIHGKDLKYINRNGNVTIYKTLPTYIRNAIDYPDSAREFTEIE